MLLYNIVQIDGAWPHMTRETWLSEDMSSGKTSHYQGGPSVLNKIQIITLSIPVDQQGVPSSPDKIFLDERECLGRSEILSSVWHQAGGF